MHFQNSIKCLSRRNRIILFLSVLFTIYITDSLLFATSDIRILNIARRLLPLCIGIIALLYYGRIDKYVLAICVSVFISMILAGRLTNGVFYITQIGIFIFAYYYTKLVDFDLFADCYLIWMRIIAIISLTCFLFSKQIYILSFIPTIRNVSNYNFKSLFFTNVPLSLSLARRNWGPFWEPGVFQFYLNVALLLSFFRRQQNWFLDVMLFIVSDLTTLSGASLLPIPFILLAYLLNEENRSVLERIEVFLLLSIGIFLIFFMGYFDEIIFKIIGVGVDSGSMGYRLGSAIANIRATLAYPLFGASPEYQDSLRENAIFLLNGVRTSGNTNTILGYFASFGIFVGGYLSYRLYRSTSVFTDVLVSRICILLAIVLMTSNENLMQSSLLVVLVFLKQKLKPDS